MKLPSSSPLLRLRSLIGLTLLLGPLCRAGLAAAQSAGPVQWTTHTIESTILGETRTLRIAIPPGHDLPQMAATRYPVVLLLDAEGDLGFAAFLANARVLANNAIIPPLIVVGIENVSDATRFRDLTLPPIDGEPARTDGGGGAVAFLDFLQNEVRPYVDARYRTHSFTLIRGHSLAGFFARWAFGQAPDFINAAIASSPTPHEQSRVLDLISARGRPGRLIMLSGEQEETLDREAQAFAAALRDRYVAGLEFEHQRIPDAAHFAASAIGIVPSLRYVFRPVSLGGYQVEFEDFSDEARVLETFTAAFDSTRAAYLRGAEQLGLPQRLPFGFLNSQTSYYDDGSATASLLLRICQEMIASYSFVWHGFECAGDALMRLGRTAEGLELYGQALSIARANGDAGTIGRLARKAATP